MKVNDMCYSGVQAQHYHIKYTKANNFFAMLNASRCASHQKCYSIYTSIVHVARNPLRDHMRMMEFVAVASCISCHVAVVQN